MNVVCGGGADRKRLVKILGSDRKGALAGADAMLGYAARAPGYGAGSMPIWRIRAQYAR